MNTPFSSPHRAHQAPRPCFAKTNFAATRAPWAPLRAVRAATSSAWLLFCLLFVSAFAAHAATLTVTSIDDTDGSTCGTTCTLRQAINAASGNGAAQNTINFDATVFASKQTIALTNGLLPLINTDITITGPTASGAGVTVDAGGNSRIFGVIGGTSTFSNLTLSGGNINGDSGAAIKQSGASTLTLNNCTIAGNTSSGIGGGGGSIDSNAKLTLNSCTVSGNTANREGGGISSSGTLTLNSCTLSGNTANREGGGIYSSGTLTLNSCTLSGNSAGNGGGVFIGRGTFNSSNTIVAGNTARTNPDLSGTINSGDYNLIGNTSGAFFSGSPSHNITDVDAKLGPLADNKGPTFTRALLAGSPAIDAGNTPFTSDQRGRVRPFDFAGVANAAGGNGSDIGAFELNETPQSGANFVVNQITDTDDGVCGPTDCTLREAINAAQGNADASTITFDATTFATRQTIALGGTVLPGVVSTITITGPAAGLNIDAGNRSGIFAVFSNPSVGDLTLSNLSLSNGNAPFGGAIDNNNGRVALTNCTLASNRSVLDGGGIYNGGTLTLTNCTLAGNRSSGPGSRGGGIFNQGTATLFNCTLAGNRSDFGGGGIFNGGTLNLNNSIVAGNSASFSGPDIFGTVTSGDYNLVQDTTNATLSGSHNVTGQDPLLGALADNRGATFTRALLAGSPAIDAGSNALIPDGVVTDQRGPGFARIVGGTVDIGAFELDPPQSGPSFVVNKTDDHDDGTCGTTDCTLREAVGAANRDGAGMDNITFDAKVFGSAQTITLAQGEIAITAAVSIEGPGARLLTIDAGGASRIFNIGAGNTWQTGPPGSMTTIAGVSLVNGNGNGNDGGAIFINDTLTLNNCTLADNLATAGGAVFGSGASTLTLNGCTLARNTATVGGAIYSSGGLSLLNCTVFGNNAGQGGGISANDVSLSSCTVTGNFLRTISDGGGIFANGTVTLNNSIVAGNQANGDPDISGTVAAGSRNNVIGGSAAQAGLDPKGLKDNGGPTDTIALTTRGSAVNRGSNAAANGLATDQRGAGFPRIVGGIVDIGAFESDFINHAPVLNNRTFTTATNAPFSQQLMATDADGDALTYTLANGTTLPAGLTLSRRGVIAGTPTTAGRTDFSVAVSDGIATTVAKFIIIVSSANDGIGPVITRNAVSSPTTRDALASSSLSGTIRDIAQRGVTPSGVSRVLVQLRDSAGNAYSGGRDGFTTNVNRGYYAATLGAPRGGVPGGARTFTRNLSWIPADLAPGDYNLVISGQDVAGNYSVEVVPVTIVAARASRAATSSQSSALRAPAPGGSGGAS